MASYFDNDAYLNEIITKLNILKETLDARQNRIKELERQLDHAKNGKDVSQAADGFLLELKDKLKSKVQHAEISISAKNFICQLLDKEMKGTANPQQRSATSEEFYIAEEEFAEPKTPEMPPTPVPRLGTHGGARNRLNDDLYRRPRWE